MAAAQVHHQVQHPLPGTVVGYLPSPVHLDDGDIAGVQQVLRLAGLALGKYPGVLQ